MKLKNLDYKRPIHFMSLAVLCLLVYLTSVGIALGQKKPPALKLDARVDDSQLCDGQGKNSLNGTQFCTLYKSYEINVKSGNLDAAQADRNDMIELVRGQVDTYYKLRKDSRRFKTKVFQTILDFLEIGGALSIAIMNGERAKSITGAAIGALQGGRTSYNKNFDLLETHVLINKMNTNRALILTEIVGNIDKPVRSRKPSEAYSWYAAKNDLRRYLFAGTYDNALDTLVRQTGADVENAERQLRRVEKREIVNQASTIDIDRTDAANTILADIQDKLAGNVDDRESATKSLKSILAELNNTKAFENFFKTKSVNDESDGEAIYKALIDLMRDKSDDEDSIILIENAIIEKGAKQ